MCVPIYHNRRTSALYQDRMWPGLPMGELLYIVAVDEVLLLTRNHQIKERKSTSSKTNLNIRPANKRHQTTNTNSYNYMQLQFITDGGTPSIALGSQISLNFSTVATVSFTRRSGKFFLKKCKLTRNPFHQPSIGRNEENTGYKSVLSWWVVVWGYWWDIDSQSVMYFSVTIAP